MSQSAETELVDAQRAATAEGPARHDSSEKLGSSDSGERKKASKMSISRWLLLAASAVAVTGTSLWWLHSRDYESTDDAQVEGHLDLVNPRISGTVTYINPQVENNQFVAAGTLLLKLDPRDFVAALEHAKADLDTSIAEARAARVMVPIVSASSFGQFHAAQAAKAQAIAAAESEEANLLAAEHKLQQDDAVLARAERDRIRYEALVEKHEISRSDYDARQTEAVAAAQALEVDRASVNATKQKITEARNLVLERQAQIDAAHIAPQQVSDARAKSDSANGNVEQARADVHTAQLNLSYTKLYAPVSGIVGRKTVELGHRVQPGQALLVIVPLDDIWITANFKETQLKRMHAREPVTIRVDTFGRDYKAKVENLPGAAGPLFSLFPPENATGNYVKVVQRFPVRIRLDKGQDPEHNLRPGMSVEPTVQVR